MICLHRQLAILREEKKCEDITKPVVYSDTKYKHFKSLNNLVNKAEGKVSKC